MKTQLQFFVLVLATVITSCSQRTIAFKKIHKFHKAGYHIKLNGKEMDPSLKFLDRDNLLRITLAKRDQTISIRQKDTTSRFLKLDSIGYHTRSQSPNDINLIVIDGVPYEKEKFSLIQIESTALKSINILRQDSLSLFHLRGDVLLITTK